MKTEFLLAERAKSEQALSDSEQRYKRLLAATTDYIYTVDLRTRTTSHGPGCFSVTGYTPDEFAADQYLWYRIIHVEDRDAVLAQVERIVHDPNPLPIEHRIIHKDGRIRWIRNTTIPHRDEQGRLVTYDGLISDITIRKDTERALRESQERMELVIQGSSDGIWDWNIVTGEAYFSPRWKHMLGYEDHDLPNLFSTWESLLHPDERDWALRTLSAYFTGQISSYEVEHRLRHKDGHYRWVLARGVVMRDVEGKPIRMAGSHVDVTERKEADARLREANASLARKGAVLKESVRRLRVSHRELKSTQLQLIQAAKLESVGTLAAGVAHEVKNPLQTLIMGLYFLEQKLPAAAPDHDPDLALTLVDMRDAVKRANSIISELLKLSAATDFVRKPESLPAIIEHALHLLRNDLLSARVDVALDFAPDLPMVEIDQTRIQQVFINLFLNAVQAMPDGGRLTISARAVTVDPEQSFAFPLLRNFRLGNVVVLAEVRDTGTGITEEVMPRVFDPFFTTKPVGVGTGLGLSVAKKIVDMHGAAIQIKNAEPKGVVVTVAFNT